MNILGPTHVFDLIIPKIEEILSIVNINYINVNNKKKYSRKYSVEEDNFESIKYFYLFTKNLVNKDPNIMDIDYDINNLNNANAKLTFTNTIGNNPLFSTPIFSDGFPSQNVNKLENIIYEENKKSGNNDQSFLKKYSEKRAINSFYVYYALKVYNKK